MSNIDEIKKFAEKRKLDENGYTFTQLLNKKELTNREVSKLKEKLNNYNIIVWKGYTFIQLGENISIFNYYTRRFAELKILQELSEGDTPLFDFAEVPYILKEIPNMQIHYTKEESIMLNKYIQHIMGKDGFNYSERNMNKVNTLIGKIFDKTEDLDLNIILAIIKYNKSNYTHLDRYSIRNNICETINKYIEETKINENQSGLRILYNCKRPKKQKVYLHEEQAFKSRKYADVDVGISTRLFWNLSDSLNKNQKEEDLLAYTKEVNTEYKKEFTERIKVDQQEEKINTNTRNNEQKTNLKDIENEHIK